MKRTFECGHSGKGKYCHACAAAEKQKAQRRLDPRRSALRSESRLPTIRSICPWCDTSRPYNERQEISSRGSVAACIHFHSTESSSSPLPASWFPCRLADPIACSLTPHRSHRYASSVTKTTMGLRRTA